MESFSFGPQGSEVPEVSQGLCLILYTYGNLRRAKALPSPVRAIRHENARKQAENRNSLTSVG